MKAIRGAHTAQANTAEAIRSCTLELLETIMQENRLQTEDIVNVTFTATRDLTAAYPAKFARELAGAAVLCAGDVCRRLAAFLYPCDDADRAGAFCTGTACLSG